MAKKTLLRPVHPGEILREEFMVPLNLSANALAKALGLTTARLARYFGTTPDFWMNLQKSYELEVASRASGAAIARTIKPRRRAQAQMGVPA